MPLEFIAYQNFEEWPDAARRAYQQHFRVLDNAHTVANISQNAKQQLGDAFPLTSDDYELIWRFHVARYATSWDNPTLTDAILAWHNWRYGDPSFELEEDKEEDEHATTSTTPQAVG